MKLVRWLAGFFSTEQPQSMSWLVVLILTVAIAGLVAALALQLTTVPARVAACIAGVISAIGGVIAYILRGGHDQRPQG